MIPKVEGPFKIVEIDPSKNRAKLEVRGRYIWDNVRLLVPFLGEELQGVAEPPI